MGNMVYALCQFGILSSIAKLGNPTMMGQFALALAISAPIFMFSNMGLRPILATDAGGNYEFSEYLGLRILCSLQAFLVLIIIIFFLNTGPTLRSLSLL
jgi:O-antigen/teichoic acid export membrane protein